MLTLPFRGIVLFALSLLWCAIGSGVDPSSIDSKEGGGNGRLNKAGGHPRAKIFGKGKPQDGSVVLKKDDTSKIVPPLSPSMERAMAVFNTKTALMQSHDKISDSRRQELLNEIIDELYIAYPSIFAMRHEYEKADPEEPDRTTVHNHCHAMDIFERLNGQMKGPRESNRIGCCTPSDTRYLHNVAITKDGHLLYSKPIEKRRLVETTANSSSSSHGGSGGGSGGRSGSKADMFKVQPSSWHLPPIKTVEGQRRAHTFNMKIDVTPHPYPPQGTPSAPVCHSSFKGTLHIIGFQTIHNVYHAMADNYIPVIGLILYDMLMYPQYAKKPRRLFIPGGGHYESYLKVVPHLLLQHDLFSGGHAHLLSHPMISGTCFDRVVYGMGPHAMYPNEFTTIRRLASEFARRQVEKMYSLQLPQAWMNGNTAFAHLSTTATGPAPMGVVTAEDAYKKEAPPLKLRIVFFSRGPSGKGRSISQEHLAVTEMLKAGHQVIYFHDYKRVDSLEAQLSLAYNSDVIMGLHGAALIHGLFAPRGSAILEWKTQYGFDSLLFHQVADSRQGTHVQIDIRSYFIPGGHRPVDPPLIRQTLQALMQLRPFLIYGKLAPYAKTSNTGNSSATSTSSRPLWSNPQAGNATLSAPVSDKNTMGIYINGPQPHLPALVHLMGPQQGQSICVEMMLMRQKRTLGNRMEDLCMSKCEGFAGKRRLFEEQEDVMEREEGHSGDDGDDDDDDGDDDDDDGDDDDYDINDSLYIL